MPPAPLTRARSLAEIARLRAEAHPERPLYTYLADGGGEERMDFSTLDRRARAVAGALRERCAPGDRALLLFPPGLDYVAAFFGCLYAGVVAVPAYPPRLHRSGRGAERLLAIAGDSRPAAALTTAALMEAVQGALAPHTPFRGVGWLAADVVEPATDDFSGAETAPEDVAFLQYTSGSTGTPKGVMVTHASLMHNEAQMAAAFRHREEETRIAGWLPMFHDMGLVGNVLHPVYLGVPCVLMSPTAFTQRPLRWLQAISEHRATTSGGPSFAYDLCVRKTSPGERAALDLSCWTVAFNGAEPVRAATLDRFAEAFAPAGFRREAFYPCYGMAEATLMITGGVPGTAPVVGRFDSAALREGRAAPAPEGTPAHRLVGCGGALPGERVVVVDPDTLEPLPEGRVGEVWAAGSSIAAGYWGRPDLSAEIFCARLSDGTGPFLRTGDLGFLREGELFVNGRARDLVIVRGRNHHPEDVEQTAEAAHPALRPGGAAVFSVEVEGEERAVAVLEVERSARSAPVAEVAAAVRRAVAEAHTLALHAVALVMQGGVPRTSSGKIRRFAAREAFLERTLEEVGRSVLEGSEAAEAAAAASALDRDALLATPSAMRMGLLCAHLRDALAALLGVSTAEISEDTSVTALGLDSVGAADLSARLEAAFGAAPAPADLLAGPTPAELAAGILRAVESGAVAPMLPSLPLTGSVASADGWLPASPGESALWVLHRMAPESTAYHVARALRLRGDLDAKALRAAWDALALRHGALRSVFSDEGGRVRRREVEGLRPDWEEVDSRGWTEARLDDALETIARRPFDPETGPLLRLALFCRGDREHVLLLVVHHLVADLGSLGVLLEEADRCYAAAREGAASALPPAPSLAAWTRARVERLDSPGGRKDAAFWAEWLRGVPALELPADRPRPAAARYRGATHQSRLAAAEAERLDALCRNRGATPFMGLLTLFQAFLHRISGQDDFAVGIPHAGRTRPGTERLVGYLVNPLPVRARLRPDAPFAQLLEEVKAAWLAAFRHAEHPFARTVDALGAGGDPARSPLFQVMLAVQTGPAAGLAVDGAGGAVPLAGTEAVPVPVDAGGAQFDLTVHTARAADGGWVLAWEYDVDLFDAATVERLAESLPALAAAAVAHPGHAVGSLPLLAGEELDRVLHTWNRTEAPRPAGLRLDTLVRKAAARAPEAVALSWEGGSETFAGVVRRAERLAARLREAGVRHDEAVGICAERSPERVVATLAVLEAGGAWLPLDPSHPRDRLAAMVRDAGAGVVLAQPPLAAVLPDTDARILALDWDDLAPDAGPAEGPGRSGAGDEALAYVIYTSGSTGRPKGVMVPHRGIVNRILWMQEAYGLRPDDVVLHKTPFTFDVSVWELFWPLAAGARLVVAGPDDHRDPERLVDTVVREGVTTLHFVPSMLGAFLRARGMDRCRSVRRVVCSGEALPPALARECMERLLWAELHNLYGPTEASVDATAWACSPSDTRPTVPIGRPIANTRAYVLDAGLEPLPAGVPGELCLGGAGLARGYASRPALTAERFVPDPLGPEPGGRLYRTGDRARWSAEGVLEYLGRTDLQVKVHGVRIEPAEVEGVLLGHPGVVAAVVDARGGAAAARLVAWIVPRGAAPSSAELRAFLAERLPAPMVPSAFVPLPALPTTASGKLDRRALPEPAAGTGGAFEPPATPAEEALAAVWAEALGVAAVGATQSFWELGGDSLLAIEAMSKARSRGLHFDLPDLFRAPTVRGLARALRAKAAGVFAADPVPPFGLLSDEDRARIPVGIEDAYPLAAIQHGLVFHAEFNPDYEIYVTSMRLRAPWSEAAMRGALDHVGALHPVLRTSYDLRRYTVPLQLVHREARIPLRVLDLRGETPAAREAAVAALFESEKKRLVDWETAPLVRMHVQLLDGDTFQLVRSDPFLDGWSNARLLTEVITAYHRLVCAEALPPGEPPSATFRDYVALEGRALASAEAEAFWSGELDGCAVCALPRTGSGRAPRGESRVERLAADVPPELSAALREVGRGVGVPLKSVLLAAHMRVLTHLAGTDDVVTGLITNGRLEQEGGERVLGSHLNVMPFRMRLRPASWAGLAREAFERERATLPHRRYPMAELQRRNGRQPLFDAVFNFTHFRPFRALAALPGVEVVDGTSSDQTYFPLTAQLNVDHDTGGVRLAFDFNTGDLTRAQVEGFAATWLRVLAAIGGDPAGRHEACDLLTDAERRAVLGVTVHPPAAFHDVAGLAARAARLAEERPGELAVSGPTGSLTRGELGARAATLAGRLLAAGIGAEDRVAVLAPRSAELVLGALAALRAGATYVPLDPASPPDRLAYMIGDSGAAALLAASSAVDLLPEPGVPVFLLDAALQDADGAGDPPPAPTPHPESLAYVVYTSGSTGRPKGVGVPHRGLMNLVAWHCDAYGLTVRDRVALVAGPGFDASVWEVWPALASGAALLAPPEEFRLAPELLRDWLLAERITVAFLPTPLAEAVVELPWPAETPLRALLTGGDRLHRHPRARLPFRLVNHYGPTENSVVATAGEVESGVAEARVPTIGRTIAGVRAHLLGPWLNPVPPGVPGELCVGGDSVARGYVGSPAATAERFVPDPSGPPGARLYRTGDRARWTDAGELEFLGRIDAQVKVRGYRVEPGEVEAVLGEHPAVREATVALRGERLVAWIVLREGGAAEAQALRAHLAGRLPEPMIPAAFVTLPAFPLTTNGKVDREALPDPGEDALASRPYVAPRTPTEQEVTEVWAAVLGAERVGVDDHFFELGGHSLLATQAVSRLRASLGVDIPLPLLFEAPVAGEFAARVEAFRTANDEAGLVAMLDFVSSLSDAEVAARLAPPAPSNPV